MAELPAYVSRRIAMQAATDIINRHGWTALGADDFDAAAARVNTSIDVNGKFATLHYTYEDKQYDLVYEWENFQ